MSLCGKQKVLEYGCGAGGLLHELSEAGAAVTAIDISNAAIEVARQEAKSHGCQIKFEVMNAESLSFGDDSFDAVVGTGILHHLDMSRAMAELSRVLTPRGHAVFIEPLGYNPVINLFRLLTRNMRTPDEHPLRSADVCVMKQYFEEVEVHPYYLLSLAAIPFRNTFCFRTILRFLERVDRAIFSVIPFSKWAAWQVFIVLSNPRRGSPAHNGSAERGSW